MNGRLEHIFVELAQTYEYIILDSAPINAVSEVGLLAQYCNKTLFVIRHGHTPKKILKNLNSVMTLLGGEDKVEIVFNQVKQRGIIKGDFEYNYGFE